MPALGPGETVSTAAVVAVLGLIVVAKVGAAIGLWVWGKRVAERRGTKAWRLAAWVPLAALILDAAGACLATGWLVTAFAAVAGADATSKATMLATGISAAMNCGAAFLFASTLLLLAAAVTFIVGSLKRTDRD